MKVAVTATVTDDSVVLVLLPRIAIVGSAATVYQYLKITTMSVKEKLTSECSGIILEEVRVKGRTTLISDESGINRKYLNRKMFRRLRFFRVIGLLYCTASWMSRRDFVNMGARLFETIYDTNEDYDGML